MSRVRVLRRLCELRALEEQQAAGHYEMAVENLHRLLRAFDTSCRRSREGRRLLSASMESSEVHDRLFGINEMNSVARLSSKLQQLIRDAEAAVESSRDRFVAKRIEKGQAESLVDTASKAAALELLRRNQLGLDDWHRFHHKRAKAEMLAD